MAASSDFRGQVVILEQNQNRGAAIALEYVAIFA
jgi:hypothetical protein